MAKKKNPKSCPSGKKLVKIKGRGSFCASKSKKKCKRGGKKSGVAAMSKAARKAILKKACNNNKNKASFRNGALCKWAKSKKS